MKIALLGYGKMGKVIEKIALERGHEIVLRKDRSDTFEGITNADIAIDFSVPTSAVSHISECLNQNIPVISGTTGWLESYPEMVNLCHEKNGSFIYASNFSLGVNIFFELNNYLAKMMKNLSDYKVSMEEIHHTQKLDAPSGTAMVTAQRMAAASSEWAKDPTQHEVAPGARGGEGPSGIRVHAVRMVGMTASQEVILGTAGQTLVIRHDSNDRVSFMPGVVLACKRVAETPGITLGIDSLL